MHTHTAESVRSPAHARPISMGRRHSAGGRKFIPVRNYHPWGLRWPAAPGALRGLLQRAFSWPRRSLFSCSFLTTYTLFPCRTSLPVSGKLCHPVRTTPAPPARAESVAALSTFCTQDVLSHSCCSPPPVRQESVVVRRQAARHARAAPGYAWQEDTRMPESRS
jgi:hypothetical protein